jgi:hypothetical protein
VKPTWRTRDVIDLEYFLKEDNHADDAAIARRDRDIYLTSQWHSTEKKICQAFFQVIRRGDEFQKERSRKRMIELLLEAMGKISRSGIKVI